MYARLTRPSASRAPASAPGSSEQQPPARNGRAPSEIIPETTSSASRSSRARRRWRRFRCRDRAPRRGCARRDRPRRRLRLPRAGRAREAPRSVLGAAGPTTESTGTPTKVSALTRGSPIRATPSRSRWRRCWNITRSTPASSSSASCSRTSSRSHDPVFGQPRDVRGDVPGVLASKLGQAARAIDRSASSAPISEPVISEIVSRSRPALSHASASARLRCRTSSRPIDKSCTRLPTAPRARRFAVVPGRR